MSLPSAPSADRNKEAIGDALKKWLDDATSVFEFGSGTGQHAVYLCRHYPHLQWQPSELAQNLDAIRGWIAREGVNNVLAPIACDVLDPDVDDHLQIALGSELGRHAKTPAIANDKGLYSLAYSANTAHIMSLAAVAAMFLLAGKLLRSDGYFALYGPFRYGMEHTAEGNLRFDAMLREQDSTMGIRDKFVLDDMATANGMLPVEDLSMPSNNRILIWRKSNAAEMQS